MASVKELIERNRRVRETLARIRAMPASLDHEPDLGQAIQLEGEAWQLSGELTAERLEAMAGDPLKLVLGDVLEAADKIRAAVASVEGLAALIDAHAGMVGGPVGERLGRLSTRTLERLQSILSGALSDVHESELSAARAEWDRRLRQSQREQEAEAFGRDLDTRSAYFDRIFENEDREFARFVGMKVKRAA